MTGKDLRAWRGDNGLTQAEAAKAAGVSQEMWSMMESGRKAIPHGFVSRLRGTPSRSSDKDRRGPYST